MAQSFVQLYVHVIFSTRDRAAFITPDLKPRLYEYIVGIARGIDCVMLSAGGVADHVHLLLSLGKQIAIADAVRDIKGNSSKWVHEKFDTHQQFAWQAGYAAFTVSRSSLDHVKAYIARQEEHHRRMTFEEEFIAFLDRHGVEYDPRYVLD
ncbi:MAG: IS200/IS605 family transposase [Phycisphaera sp.]|nr:IS200/IS605 family transposase [Phycisphaera sp.]